MRLRRRTSAQLEHAGTVFIGKVPVGITLPAANAGIGIQRVAYLLSLGLSVSVGNAGSRVGNQLSWSRSLNAQGGLRRAASQAADLTEQQLLNRYKAAQVSYTEVVTAQASALNARRTVVQLAANRQAAAIALIQALGESWHAPT